MHLRARRALSAAAALSTRKAALMLDARRQETERRLTEETLKQQEAEARLRSHSVLVAAARRRVHPPHGRVATRRRR
jgi:hypothetical protein